MGPLLAGNDTFSRPQGFYLCNSREVANVEGGKRFRVTRIRGSGGSQGSGGAHRRAQVRAALVSPSAFTLGPRAAQQTSSATTTVTSVTSVTSEPDATPVSTHVLTTEAVRWGIDTLGGSAAAPDVRHVPLPPRTTTGRATWRWASASSDELLALISTCRGLRLSPTTSHSIDRGKRKGQAARNALASREHSG